MNLKQLTLAAGAVAMLGFAPVTAEAVIVTDVDLLDGSGGTLASNVRELDYAPGAGVAKGVGPFGAPLAVGDTFDFVYQSVLTGASDAGAAAVPFAATLNTSGAGGALAASEYQFTIVARFEEIVTFATPTQANFGLGPGGGTISIFYDEDGLGTGDTVADVATGIGFDDGTEIARFTVTSQTSGFVAAGGGGIGGTLVNSQLQAITDFVDPTFILGQLDPVFDLEFSGSLLFPANSPVSGTTALHQGGSAFYPDEVVAANDILFQVDGSNTFSVIPEPVTLMLFGFGLLLLGAFARQRRTTA